MSVKITPIFFFLFIASLTYSSNASDSELLKILDTAGHKCYQKYNVSIDLITDPHSVAGKICTLDCMASELNLYAKPGEKLTECSEPENDRVKHLTERFEKEKEKLMNNGTFAHILQDESLFSNSSKFGHLIEGAGRTCDSKFHISGAEYLSSMFNPFKFVEIAVTEFCSINCMFNELKIVDENGPNSILKTWMLHLYHQTRFDSKQEDDMKATVKNINDKCKSVQSSAVSRDNLPFGSAILLSLFIASSLAYSIHRS